MASKYLTNCPFLENGFYLKFLRGGLMDPETSMEIIRNYYKLKMNNPQYFKVRPCLHLVYALLLQTPFL